MAPVAGSAQSGSSAALMFGVNFVVNLTVSIVAPILPQYLAERRLLPPGPLGASVKGMLFSSASVATLVVTPCAPALMRRCGKYAACTGGLLLFSAGILVFGLTDRIVAAAAGEEVAPLAPHPHAELAILFVARVMTAAGGTVAMLGSMSIAMDANPGNRGALMGASETAIGVGFSVGPSIGAAFFTAGGFPAPFAAASVMSLGLLPLLALSRGCGASGAALEEAAGEGGASEEGHGGSSGNGECMGSPPSPWSSPAALSVALVAVASLFCFGFLDPTLAPFEAEILGATTAGAGVLFSCAAFPYALLGTVVGALVDAAPGSAAAMICGGGIALGATVMVLPPLAPFMATWAWQVVVLFVLGLAVAFAMVPVVPLASALLQEEARAAGRPAVDEDVVLSFTWMAFTLGELSGPLAGSYLAGVYGFPAAARGTGAFTLLVIFATTLVLGASGQFTCRRRRAQVAAADEPLLERRFSSPGSHGTDMKNGLLVSRALSGTLG